MKNIWRAIKEIIRPHRPTSCPGYVVNKLVSFMNETPAEEMEEKLREQFSHEEIACILWGLSKEQEEYLIQQTKGKWR